MSENYYDLDFISENVITSVSKWRRLLKEAKDELIKIKDIPTDFSNKGILVHLSSKDGPIDQLSDAIYKEIENNIAKKVLNMLQADTENKRIAFSLVSNEKDLNFFSSKGINLKYMTKWNFLGGLGTPNFKWIGNLSKMDESTKIEKFVMEKYKMPKEDVEYFLKFLKGSLTQEQKEFFYTLANLILSYYQTRPTEFEKRFGFPMIDKETLKLNSNQLLVDLIISTLSQDVLEQLVLEGKERDKNWSPKDSILDKDDQGRISIDPDYYKGNQLFINLNFPVNSENFYRVLENYTNLDLKVETSPINSMNKNAILECIEKITKDDSCLVVLRGVSKVYTPDRYLENFKETELNGDFPIFVLGVFEGYLDVLVNGNSYFVSIDDLPLDSGIEYLDVIKVSP